MTSGHFYRLQSRLPGLWTSYHKTKLKSMPGIGFFPKMCCQNVRESYYWGVHPWEKHTTGEFIPKPESYGNWSFQFSSVQFRYSVVSDSLRPHESQHTRLPCPSPTPGVDSNSCPSSWWCHPAISSSVVPFSSCPQSFPASGSFPISQLFAWGGQSIGVSASASVLPMNIQDWSPLGWTVWISLQSKGLSRVL